MNIVALHPDFDVKRELARERAKALLGHKWATQVSIGKTAYGIDFGLELSTYECGLCHGRFPESGFVVMWYEDTSIVYGHQGCVREAKNWAYDPAEDDYPR